MKALFPAFRGNAHEYAIRTAAAADNFYSLLSHELICSSSSPCVCVHESGKERRRREEAPSEWPRAQLSSRDFVRPERVGTHILAGASLTPRVRASRNDMRAHAQYMYIYTVCGYERRMMMKIKPLSHVRL